MTTQNDHNRLLDKFENDQTKFGCVGSCGYAPASVESIRENLYFKAPRAPPDFRAK